MTLLRSHRLVNKIHSLSQLTYMDMNKSSCFCIIGDALLLKLVIYFLMSSNLELCFLASDFAHLFIERNPKTSDLGFHFLKSEY